MERCPQWRGAHNGGIHNGGLDYGEVYTIKRFLVLVNTVLSWQLDHTFFVPPPAL